MKKNGYCIQDVYPNDTWGSFRPHQCSRKIWKDSYCKLHHPETVAQKRAVAEEKYKKSIENHPLILLKKANERIAQLEEQLKQALAHSVLKTDGTPKL